MLFLSDANSIGGGCYNDDSCPYGNDKYQRPMRSLSSFLKMDWAATNAKTFSTGIDGFLKSRVTRIHSDRMGISSPDNQCTTIVDDDFS